VRSSKVSFSGTSSRIYSTSVSPSLEMWLAPTELLEFASIVAQHMLAAHPDLIDKGICIAVYNSGGIAVSMVPLGTVH
jgi:hypothetical protein